MRLTIRVRKRRNRASCLRGHNVCATPCRNPHAQGANARAAAVLSSVPTLSYKLAHPLKPSGHQRSSHEVTMPHKTSFSPSSTSPVLPWVRNVTWGAAATALFVAAACSDNAAPPDASTREVTVRPTLVAPPQDRPMDADSGHIVAFEGDTIEVRGHLPSDMGPGSGSTYALQTAEDEQLVQTVFDREVLNDPSALKASLSEHMQVGDDALDKKDYPAAILAFRRALAQGATAPVYSRLGHAYLMDNQADRAIDCYEEALVKDRELPEVRSTLARMYLDKENGDEAAHHAQFVIRHDEAAGRYLLGRAHIQRAMWDEAIAELSRAADLDEDNPYLMNNLGFAALQVGRYDIAVDALEETLQAKAPRPYMMNNLGLAYEKTERRTEALAAYTRALDLSPRYPNAVINQARIQATMTREEIALAQEVVEDFRQGPETYDDEDVLARALSPNKGVIPAE